MIKIGIIGSCIGRDIFNYDEDNLFKVVSYYNFCSMLAYSKTAKEKRINDSEVSHKSNWYSRVICADINKDFLEKIAQSNPDYLVIDLMTERLSAIKAILDNQEVWLTAHNDLKNTELMSSGRLKLLDDKVSWQDLTDEEMERIVESFCKKICMLFSSEKIIFVETKMLESYVDEKGNIKSFDESQIERARVTNKYFEKIELYMLRYLKPKYVVTFPKNNYSDSTHHLNLQPCHYWDPTYIYMYEEIKNCVSCNMFNSLSTVMTRINKYMGDLLIRKVVDN